MKKYPTTPKIRLLNAVLTGKKEARRVMETTYGMFFKQRDNKELRQAIFEEQLARHEFWESIYSKYKELRYKNLSASRYEIWVKKNKKKKN